MSSALLRIVVCGAVDDGKSTVLGRLLVETNSIPLDEIDNSRLMANGEVDYSQLTDGLESEREQRRSTQGSNRPRATRSRNRRSDR